MNDRKRCTNNDANLNNWVNYLYYQTVIFQQYQSIYCWILLTIYYSSVNRSLKIIFKSLSSVVFTAFNNCISKVWTNWIAPQNDFDIPLVEKFLRGGNLAQLAQNERFTRQSNINTRRKSCANLNPSQNFSD